MPVWEAAVQKCVTASSMCPATASTRILSCTAEKTARLVSVMALEEEEEEEEVE